MKIIKFIYQPVTPFHINQGFGANQICINKKDNSDVINCDGLNPPVGYRSIYGAGGHNGLDLRAKRFTPIYSSQDGIVTEVVDEELRGMGLGITTTNPFYCKETNSIEHFKLRYWHNFTHKVRLGDKVSIGDLIAWADNTGYSSGDHLHFECKPVSISYKKDGTIKKTTNILQDNGYYGGVNPMDYMEMKPATTWQGIKSFKERLAWMLINTK